MATEALPRSLRRRRLLLAAASGLAMPGLAAASAAPRLRFATAWNGRDATHHIGVIELVEGRFRIRSRLEVPTRAHDLRPLPDGSILAVARRPGEWIVRWHPQRSRARWHWSDAGRTFNGHLVVDRAYGQVLTTETDADSGEGLVGVRDLATLALRATWRTHGRDPHMLMADGTGWLVANGGILTLPETGRSKLELDRMDASLVRLDASGSLAGQWRLEDPRLGLRHLARNGPLVGIALQAEHEDAATRERAPLLALFDGYRLRVVDAGEESTGGYAGDIDAWDADGPAGFALGATRAGQVFGWDAVQGFRAIARLPQACAVTASKSGVWAAGPRDAARLPDETAALPEGMRLDNHWRPLA